jgi:RHS repeat-associated protein
VQYNYTSLGFLYYVSDAADQSLYWAATGRDALGRVTTEYTRNGVETTSIRNQATGWLMASHSNAHADGDALIQNWGYQFDEVGNLKRRIRADAVNGPASDESFTYDSLNRLQTSTTNVGSSTYNDTFNYDAIGNLRLKDGKSYTYGTEAGCVAGPHAVCTVDGGSQFEYDANGNTTFDGNRFITYDLANKVTHIQSGGNFADFIYDGDSHRVVQETSGGGHTTRTLYVGLGATGKSIYERAMRDDGGVEYTQFLYAPGEHYGNAFAIRVVNGGTTGAASTTLSFNHFDHLGSVTGVSDEQGHVVSAEWGGPNATVAGYDPWGARRSPDGRPADPASFKPLPGHREFTGHETIPGVGLINMNGRVYDPMIGRFLSPDPNVQFVADLQSYNRYSYVLNNPLRYTDPTGFFLDSAGEMFGTLFGIAAAAVCAVATEGACAVAIIAVTAYSATTMAMNGASFEQIVEMSAVSLAAGFVSGGVVGGAIGSNASIVASMIGGAMSSMMSSVITAAVLGTDLGGEDLLGGMLVGAVSSGVAAGLRGAPLLSQKSSDQVYGNDRSAKEKSAPAPDSGNRKIEVKDDKGKVVGYIEVLKFKEVSGGVDVLLGFKCTAKCPDDLNWLQTVKTSRDIRKGPTFGKEAQFNDNGGGGGTKYYMKPDVSAQQRGVGGFDARFWDEPTRTNLIGQATPDVQWRAELSLLSMKNNAIMITLTYGFSIDALGRTSIVQPSAASPSTFQQNTVKGK